MIKMIAAVSKDFGIGKGNKLLFRLKPDMDRFRSLTAGNVVVMGRKTYESIGKALPGRTNIVLSRSAKPCPGCLVYADARMVVDDANACAFGSRDIYIIGGESVYRQFIDFADEILLTLVDEERPDADAHFPTGFERRAKDVKIGPWRSYDGLLYKYLTYVMDNGKTKR